MKKQHLDSEMLNLGLGRRLTQNNIVREGIIVKRQTR
jgi:hypothetical protein